MKDLIKIAAAELGVGEIPGEEDNPRIVQYAQEAGFTTVDDDETAWCSIFMNWVAREAGLQRSSRANARSWLDVGRSVANPEPGDVVVFWRDHPDSWKGHVGIYMGYAANSRRVYVLGGNQVSLSAYDASRVLGFRRLSTDGDEPLAAPGAAISRGAKGPAVRELQDALKAAGFDAGTTDGDYGRKTARAVRALQTAAGDITVDGQYNDATRDHLVSLLA